MKKLVYIFSLLLLACACNLEDFEPQTSGDSDKVMLSLSLSVPEAQSLTRAMDNKPQLRTLHLVVFDQNGMLVEYAEAEPQNLEQATENGTPYNFNVALTISDTPRHIHFVGNSPAAPKFGMETEVMTTMETESGADAYWYRKTIAKIEADKDGAPTEDTKKAFGVIPLVRNFAKIVVTSSVSTEIFKLDSYAIAGRPEKGKVAPYNRNKGDFQDFVTTDGLMKSYEELTAEGYDAFSPTGVGLDFDLEDSDFNNNSKYVYERETSLSDASYVIVKGYYNGRTETPVYYKVNLRDDAGNYVPLRRNFQYTIDITSVTRNGYTDLEAAKKSSGSGDISTNQDYIPLTNISDGEVRLSVEYTSKTLVSSAPVELNVKFDKVGTNSNNITLGNLIAKEGPAGETGAVFKSVSDPKKNDDGSFTYTITPVTDNTQKTQSLFIIGQYKINGSNTDLTISREVSYTLMEKKDMKAQCIPSEVPNVQGQEFDLQITIPGGLGKSMFPLEFSIEAVELSITPKNDDMPVSSGTSTIENSTSGRVGKSSFWFVKTLSWEEYNPQQPNSFLCHFATNKANSATDIYVSNPYFNQTICTLDNYDNPNYFEKLKYDKTNPYPIVAKTPVNFTFNTTELPSSDITVTLTGLEPAKGDKQLKPAGVDAYGNRKYTLSANATSYTLNLVATNAYTDFNVKLEAYHFVTAQASAKRDRMNFSNLTLPTTRVGTQDVEFRFKYANNSVVPVRIKLTNLVSNDERLVENKNEGVFVFTPTSDADTQTISLKTDSWGSKIGVKIVAADGYNVPVSVTANRVISATITSTGLNLGFMASSRSVTISLNDDMSDPIGTETFTETTKLNINGDFGDDPSRPVYFTYSSIRYGTFTASTTLADLAAESPTLTFLPQQ